MMTQERWVSLTEAERAKLRDLSGLTATLIGHEGHRVEVERMNGSVDRFKVGRSTGWKPCHVELRNARSRGGLPADREYRSVKRVR